MEEKKLYHIYNKEVDMDNYVRLRDNEYSFYRWLQDNGYLDEYTCIERMDSIPIITEFQAGAGVIITLALFSPNQIVYN